MMTKGLNAYKEGRFEIAVPAFECVISEDADLQKLHAEFYLARIYGDETSGFVDHFNAYMLFLGLADKADGVDPDDTRQAAYIAKAVTAVAGYVRRGLPASGLKPDMERAVEYYRTAATVFNEPDAQFELAKLYLTGIGVPKDVKLGLHYIQKLVQDSHPGAQAYLADLYWRGMHVPVDRTKAFALIKLAMENATPSDRLWIEDSYQSIYCGTATADRSRAGEIASAYRKIFARSYAADRSPLGQPTMLGRSPTMTRACGNGEPIEMNTRGDLAAPPLATTLTDQQPQKTSPAGVRTPVR